MNNRSTRESHFHAVLFVFLVGFSVFYFTYCALTPKYFLSPYGTRDQDIIGLLLLFWTGLMATKLLWMLEINIFSKAFRTQIKTDKNLPQRLLNDLSYRHMVQDASRSWKALNILSITWLVLGGLFILWGIFIVYHPLGHQNLTHLQIDISAFLKTQAIENETIQLHNFSFLLSQVIKILLVGIAFWLGQILSYGYKNISIILWICLTIFGLSFISYITGGVVLADMSKDLSRYSDNFWHGYGWENMLIAHMMEIIPSSKLSPLQNRLLATGIPSLAILYSLGLLSFIVVLQGLFLADENRKYALIGCIILLIMGCCDIFLVQKNGLYGVWISGWVCVAILWVKAGSRAQKYYRMFLQ